MIYSCCSKEFPEYPAVEGVVRAWVYLSGLYIEENRSDEGISCKVRFITETDIKV